VSRLNRHRAVALLALAGLFLSVYLFLYAKGFYGFLACGAGGGCDLVQGSRWAEFLGFPVAGWGMGWYLAVFVVSLISVQVRAANVGWVTKALFCLSVGGVGFTIYLTALEIFVIGAICRWCVGSALLTVAIFSLVVPEAWSVQKRRIRTLRDAD
jgi:uncharacterized membrane protein